MRRLTARSGGVSSGGFGGSSGGTTGFNVAFQSGRYYYLVGAGYPTGAPNMPSRAAVILAAQRLYARVHR